MLGIVIGVFSVVALVSVVKGFENYITGEFAKIGSNLLFISPGRFSAGSDPAMAFTDNKLELSHVGIIKTELGDRYIGVTPYIEIMKTAKFGTKSYLATVVGNNEMLDILGTEVSNGRFFNKAEVDGKARVTAIGKVVADNLFGSRSPVGQKIKIDGESYEVIGILKEQGANFDTLLYIPYTTVRESMGVKNISSILIKLKEGQNVKDTQKLTEIALLRVLKKDDFTVLTQEEILTSVNSILNVISIGLTIIASISLLVGGIGIMNIMLVSVTERTNEIGLRKALGATSWNISLQFMSEAVFISIVGGIMGLMSSWLLTIGIHKWIQAQITPWAIALALGFSLLVGIVFGTYPALEASKKDPIESLRYE